MTRGWKQGRVAGRERFEAGEVRRAERDRSREQWEHAKTAAGFEGFGSGLAGRWRERVERARTCPGCGHGNRLNESRVGCGCARGGCACGDESRAPVELGSPAADLSAPAAEAAPLAAVPDQPASTTTEQVTKHSEQSDEKETSMSAPTAPNPAANGEVINIDSILTALGALSTRQVAAAEQQGGIRAEKDALVASYQSLLDGCDTLDMAPQDKAEIVASMEQAQSAAAKAAESEAAFIEAAGLSQAAVAGIGSRHRPMMEAAASQQHVAHRQAYTAA